MTLGLGKFVSIKWNFGYYTILPSSFSCCFVSLSRRFTLSWLLGQGMMVYGAYTL